MSLKEVSHPFPLEILANLEDRHLNDQSQWRNLGEEEGGNNSGGEEDRAESRRKTPSLGYVRSSS